jgi:excisionase family DNA binding protein
MKKAQLEICLKGRAYMVVATVQKPDRGGSIGEGFVTVREAAEYLRLCRAKLYQMMDAGDLPYAKFGKSRRIARRDLVEFAERCIIGNRE